MKIRKFSIFFIILVCLTLPNFYMVEALNTESLPSNYLEMNSHIPLDIYNWGFETNIIEILEEILPTTFLQESYFPKSNSTQLWWTSIESQTWGLENAINYTFHDVSQITINGLINDLITLGSDELVDFPELSNTPFSGLAIPGYFLDNFFSNYVNLQKYTIHLANFSEIDNTFENHWFNLGETHQISNGDQDMRNLIYLGERQILFDPTAIAPYFLDQQIDYTDVTQISEYLTLIIEQLIAGSSQSNNLLFVKNIVQLDRIVIYEGFGNLIQSEFEDFTARTNFISEVNKIFPSISISQNQFSFPADSEPELSSYINQNMQTIGTERYLFVDSSMAELFKNVIRENQHRSYPDGWYYGLFYFGFDNLNLVYDLSGDQFSILEDYSVGEIGFSAHSLDEWDGLPSSKLTTEWSTYVQLRLLGQTFGFSGYASSFINQIESPLSTYGVTELWDMNFPTFDIDQFQRRYALTVRSEIQYGIDLMNREFNTPYYFWLDYSELDRLSNLLNEGDAKMEMLNYTGAYDEYLDALDEFEELSTPFIYSRNFVRYGSIMMVFVVLLMYYSDILIHGSIDKEEFKKRLKKLRNHSLSNK